MEEVKLDPRITRTKKLIIDAFLELSTKKEFREINVKDITTEARINRATFYNHFLDKYDLLEKVAAEKLSLNLRCDSQSAQLSIRDTIKSVFLSLTSVVASLEHYRYSQGEVELVEGVIQKELMCIFRDMLITHSISTDLPMLQKLARLLTHSVAGMSHDWNKSGIEESPEDYIDSMLPFLLNGLESR